MFEKGVTSPGNSTSNHCLKLRRFNFPLLVKVINNNVFINDFKCFAYVFILILRESFNNRFQDDIQEGFTILIKKTRFSFVDDISQALFPPLSPSYPGGGARAYFPNSGW